MTAAIDLEALLPSERRELRGALAAVQAAEAELVDVTPVLEALREAGPDDVIVMGLGEDGEAVRAVSRETWRTWTGRDAPPAKGAALPLMQAWSTGELAIEECNPSWLDRQAEQAFLGHVSPAGPAVQRLAETTAAARAVVDSIAQEQAAQRSARSRAASTQPYEPPAPSVRFSDLSAEQLLTIRERSPAVFDRLLAAHRRERGASPAPSSTKAWSDDYTAPELAQMQRTDPARFSHLLAEHRARKSGSRGSTTLEQKGH